jgi:hypothetical protein
MSLYDPYGTVAASLREVPPGLKEVKEALEIAKGELAAAYRQIYSLRVKAEAYDLVCQLNMRNSPEYTGTSEKYIDYRIDEALRVVNERLTTEEPPVPPVDAEQAGLFDEKQDPERDARNTV